MIITFLVIGIIALLLSSFTPMLSPEGGGVSSFKIFLILVGIGSLGLSLVIWLLKLIF